MENALEGTAKAVNELNMAVRARVPVIGIETHEEGRVVSAIKKMAATPVENVSGEIDLASRRVFLWTHTQGVVPQEPLPACTECGEPTFVARNDENQQVYACADGHQEPTEFAQLTNMPHDALADFFSFAQADGTDEGHRANASFLVMCDIHRFLDGTDARLTMRDLRDAASILPPTQSGLILISPVLGSMGDAERQVARVSWPLPTVAELSRMIKRAGAKLADRIPVDLNGSTEVLAAALAALTMDEAARVLRKVIVKSGKLDGSLAPQMVAEKAAILQAAAGIELRTPRFGLDDVGGLEAAKSEMQHLPLLLSEAAKEANVRAPRGYLLAGPPGTGKSLLAEVVAATANVPLLRWDMGGTKGHLYGQTEEQAAAVLKSADALDRCVLWIDEAEKQLASGTGGGETHEVTEALKGALLTWMQDRESDVIVIMTVNHPERLAEEMLSRFDSNWFVDYPEEAACRQILAIHTERRGMEITPADLAGLARAAYEQQLCGREIEYAVEQAKRQAFIEGRTADEVDLMDAIASTPGLAGQAQRRAAIQGMREQCRGQFQPAGDYKWAKVNQVTKVATGKGDGMDNL